jgi:hypothetical protein
VMYLLMLEGPYLTFVFYMPGHREFVRHTTEASKMTQALPINTENNDLRPSASTKASQIAVLDVPDIAKSNVLMERDLDCNLSLRTRH